MNPPTSHWHILIIGIYFNTMTWNKVKLYTVSNPTEASSIIIYIYIHIFFFTLKNIKLLQ